MFYINPDISHIVNPNSIESSALFYRLSSEEGIFKMPFIGTTLNHEEGINLIEDWINSLTQECN
jgi:hypothetical protein